MLSLDSHFLALSAEIRVQIYNLYFAHLEVVVVEPSHRHKPVDTALYLVNKAVRDECSRMLFGHNKFLISVSEGRPLTFWPEIPEALTFCDFQYIRHLQLNLVFGYVHYAVPGPGGTIQELRYIDGPRSLNLRRSYVEEIVGYLRQSRRLETLHGGLSGAYDFLDDRIVEIPPCSDSLVFPLPRNTSWAAGSVPLSPGLEFPRCMWTYVPEAFNIPLGLRAFGITVHDSYGGEHELLAK